MTRRAFFSMFFKALAVLTLWPVGVWAGKPTPIEWKAYGPMKPQDATKAQFRQMVEMGFPIPALLLIAASNIPSKEEIMKVRHKQHPDVIVELDANTREQWLAGLPKAEWEPVPTDHWQDVTGECEVEWDGAKLRYPDGRENELPLNYRLRKVQFEWFHGVPLGDAQAGWAFIVERKVGE